MGVRCPTAVADSATLDATLVAAACKGFAGDLTAGFLEITFGVLDAIVMLLLGTCATALGYLLVWMFAVGTAVHVRHVSGLSDRELCLELLVDQGNVFLQLLEPCYKCRVRQGGNLDRAGGRWWQLLNDYCNLVGDCHVVRHAQQILNTFGAQDQVHARSRCVRDPVGDRQGLNILSHELVDVVVSV